MDIDSESDWLDADDFDRARFDAAIKWLDLLPGFAIAMLDTWIVTHEDLKHVPRVRAVFDALVTAFAATPSANSGNSPPGIAF